MGSDQRRYHGGGTLQIDLGFHGPDLLDAGDSEIRSERLFQFPSHDRKQRCVGPCDILTFRSQNPHFDTSMQDVTCT